MRKVLFALIVTCCLPLICAARQGNCPETGRKPGQFSQLSVEACFHANTDRRHLQITSPGGSIILVVTNDTGQLYKDGQRLGAASPVGDEELLWSPDSRAIISTLYLGNAGPIAAGVSFVGGHPAVPAITKIVQKEFANRHRDLQCSEAPNVAGLRWLRDSREAVFVAEIQPLHCYPAGGYFEAYVVPIPEGKVLAIYPMGRAIKRFRNALGPRLLDDIKLQEEQRKGH